MLTLTFHGHVQPRAVIPMHYNTWDVIKADPAAAPASWCWRRVRLTPFPDEVRRLRLW